MNFISGTMVFLVTWWTVFFMVLPFGIQQEDNPEKGLEPGAPKNPQLKKKMLITTLLTSIIWIIIQYIMVNHLICFS